MMKIEQKKRQPEQRKFSEDVKKKIAEKISAGYRKENPDERRHPKSGKGL